MRTLRVVFVAAALCLSMAAAWSYPTFDGGSGIVTAQTAEVAPVGSVDLALDYQKIQGETIWPLRAAVGVANQAEVWAGYSRLKPAHADETGNLWDVGAKYLLLAEPKNKVSLAIGGQWGRFDGSGDIDKIDISKGFIAVTKNLSMKQVASREIAAKATLGLLYQRLGNPIDESSTKPYVGIEFTGKRGASLGLEYRWKDSSIESKSVFSAVVRVPVNQRANPVWVELGTTNASAGLGTNEQKIIFGVGYRFGAWVPGGSEQSGVRSGPWGY